METDAGIGNVRRAVRSRRRTGFEECRNRKWKWLKTKGDVDEKGKMLKTE